MSDTYASHGQVLDGSRCEIRECGKRILSISKVSTLNLLTDELGVRYRSLLVAYTDGLGMTGSSATDILVSCLSASWLVSVAIDILGGLGLS